MAEQISLYETLVILLEKVSLVDARNDVKRFFCMSGAALRGSWTCWIKCQVSNVILCDGRNFRFNRLLKITFSFPGKRRSLEMSMSIRGNRIGFAEQIFVAGVVHHESVILRFVAGASW